VQLKHGNFAYLSHPESAMAEKLDINDMFPSVRFSLVDGGVIDLPRDLSAKYTVVLVYRGHW
jgi:hypothetical protein